MIDLQKPNEWQKYDPETRLLFPWLVESFLEELKTWDLKDSGHPYDIIVVDGEPVEWRDDCIRASLNCIKKGGKLIVDNWLQPSVWMAFEETQNLLRGYPSKIYKQESHPDWQTVVFDII